MVLTLHFIAQIHANHANHVCTEYLYITDLDVIKQSENSHE